MDSHHMDSAMVASLRDVCLPDPSVLMDVVAVHSFSHCHPELLYEYFLVDIFSVWHLDGFIFFVIKNSAARNTLFFSCS